MAKGLVIPLTADIRKFIKGMRLSAEAVEEIGEEFDDVERKSENAADDMVREYERAFDRLERAADNADLDVSDGIEGAAGNAKVAAGALAGEVVDEFVENWGEAVRSGDYASAVRETLSQLGQIGGAIGGPVGAVIGGAVALGLTTAFDAALGKDQRIRDAANNLFTEVVGASGISGKEAAAAFSRGWLEQTNIEGQLVEALGVDDYKAAVDEIQRIRARTGLKEREIRDLLLGQKGAQEDLRALLDQTNAELEESSKYTKTEKGDRGQLLSVDSERTAQLKNQKAELEGLLGISEEQERANKEAADDYETHKRLMRGVKEEAEGVKKAVKETPDEIKVKAKVDKGEVTDLDNSLKKPRNVSVTATVYARASSAKVQRLINEGII